MKVEQETGEDAPNEEQAYQGNDAPEEVEIEQGDYADAEESTEQEVEHAKSKSLRINIRENRGNFIHGLAVGLGIGCIATFVIVWISLFFTPQLPGTVTYENLLSIFIYPLIYLLAVGLVALTAGIVREYFGTRSRY
jgi:hypothetical protein